MWPIDPQLTWAGALYVASEWVIRIAMLFYVPQKRTPAAARTWLLFIFLVPWAGLAFYALVGRIYLPKRGLRLAARAQPILYITITPSFNLLRQSIYIRKRKLRNNSSYGKSLVAEAHGTTL